MDKNVLYQIDVREWIEKTWGNELMIPIYGSLIDNNYDKYLQCYLIPIEHAEEKLDSDTYDIGSSLLPGCTQYGAGEVYEVVYSRFNNDENFEPLVINRNYNGLAEDSIEILEEFRLLYNLFYDQHKDKYIDLENGNDVIIIKDKKAVFIHKKYIKSFLSLKKMALVMNIDCRVIFSMYDKSLRSDTLAHRSYDDACYYTLNIGECNTGLKMENFSLFYGKKLLYGCELKECGIWPYNEEKKYVDFIIGIDENGKEITYTSNPAKLSNYFGANPEAPNYLTPVFFDPAVLNKYYLKPEIYEVKDCIIRCGTLWSLYIDNQNKEHVSAYLGDLGRDLPNESEQYYWRSYNKATDGKLSKTKFNRDFMAQFTDPESEDFIFKNLYVKVNQNFEKIMGWSLFLPLEEKDVYNFEGIRIPKTNSIVEIDMLVLYLVKVLLDSLNEKCIRRQLTGTYEKLTGSISILEVWFTELQLESYQLHIKFLRNLQELRSSGTGHRKGKSYNKISQVFELDKGNYVGSFTTILSQSIDFLKFVGIE